MGRAFSPIGDTTRNKARHLRGRSGTQQLGFAATVYAAKKC
jgi:hypothetical protein